MHRRERAFAAKDPFRSRIRRAAGLVLVLSSNAIVGSCMLGCSSKSASSADAGTSASASLAVAPDNGAAPPTLIPSASAAGVPSGAPSTTYEDETSTRPMELLKFQFSSGIDARKPKDKMVLATPGDRVYAFLTLRNRSGRKRQIHMEFRVNGDKRTEMDLDVAESWSFRTWAYNTISSKDKPGKLTLTVTDDAGNPVTEESLPIVKKPGAK